MRLLFVYISRIILLRGGGISQRFHGFFVVGAWDMLSLSKPIFAFFKRLVGWHDTEGYASLHPRLRATRSARAFDLSGRAAVKQVMISLSEVVLLGMMTTSHRSLRSLYVVLTKNQPL